MFPIGSARASTDAPWFDCISLNESERDEDFYSVRDGEWIWVLETVLFLG